jgi:hypothetical protein
MAIASPNVIQPQQQGGQALMQLAQILGQQQQFKSSQAQQQGQFDDTMDFQTGQALQKRQDAIADAQRKQQQGQAQAKWDRYLSVDAGQIINNPNVLEDFLQAGSILGQVDENTTFDEVLATLSNTKKEQLAFDEFGNKVVQKDEDQYLANLRFAFDQHKWDKEFGLKAAKAKADGNTVPFEVKQNYELAKGIMKEVFDLPVNERGAYIEEMGRVDIINSFNAQADKYGMEGFNLSNLDQGDWNPFTPRYESSAGFGTGTKERPTVYSAGALAKAKRDAKLAGAAGDEAREIIKANPDKFSDDLVSFASKPKQGQEDEKAETLIVTRAKERLLSKEPHVVAEAKATLRQNGLTWEQINQLVADIKSTNKTKKVQPTTRGQIQ